MKIKIKKVLKNEFTNDEKIELVEQGKNIRSGKNIAYDNKDEYESCGKKYYIKNLRDKNINGNIKKDINAPKRSGYINDKNRNNKDNDKDRNENINYKKVGINIALGNLFKNKNKLSRGYYVLLFAMVLLGCISVGLATKSYNLFEKENYATYGEEETTTVSSSIDNTNVIDKSIEDVDNIKISTNVETSKIVPVVTAPKVVPLQFSKPLNGNILKMFSDDKVIYSKTLELWKTHDGIDISGNIGDSVKSIEKGKIEKIYEDSFLGITIVIDHGQGYKSSYSNLDKDVLVKEGQTIKKGQAIGKISNTAIGEIKDDSHLHFMLYKNGNIVDPTYIFK